MPVVFKDFEKESNDFFDKYYVKGLKGSFKLETKGKASNKTLYVNSAFEENVFTVNFQYDVKESNIKTKTGINSKQKVSAKATYEAGDNKIEVTESFPLLNIFDYAGKIVTESKVKVLPTPVNIYSESKFSRGSGYQTDLMFSADFPGIKGLQIGGSTNIDVIKQRASKQKVGFLYTNTSGNCTSRTAVGYSLNGEYSAGILATLKNFSKLFGTVEVAAQTIFTDKEKVTSAGLGFVCPLTGSNVRSKLSLSGNYGVSLYRSFPNNVTVGGGFEGSIYDLSKCPLEKLTVSVVSE